MGKINKEFKIGVTVLASIALLYFGINYLKGINIFQKNESFYAIYKDVKSLTPSSPVMYNGLKVGLVKRVSIDAKDRDKMIVEFIIRDSELQIPIHSIAEIETQILGATIINLKLGKSDQYSSPGDTIGSALTLGLQEQFEPLKNKTEELISSIDGVITNLNSIFDKEITDGLPASFKSLQNTLKSLEGTTGDLNNMIVENRPKFYSVMTSADSLMLTIASNRSRINIIMENFESISDSIAKANIAETISNVNHAVAGFASILDEIENGNGSITKLLKTDSLHTELVETNEALQVLLDDFKVNPGRYVNVSVFGKRQRTKYSKKEEEQLRELIDEEFTKRGIE